MGLDEFITTLKTQVDIFANRMKSNSSRGRSIVNDTSVQTLFMNTMHMHGKLLEYIQEQDSKRHFYERLQDKLIQIKESREALNALREEEKERVRREAEIAERSRQIQMRAKLGEMRRKKQEYLNYQLQQTMLNVQQRQMDVNAAHDSMKSIHNMNFQVTPMHQPSFQGKKETWTQQYPMTTNSTEQYKITENYG